MDLKRAFISRWFFISAFSVTMVLILNGYYEYEYLLATFGDIASLYDFILNTGVYIDILVLLAGLCYSSSFYRDWKDKAIYFIIGRSGYKKYCLSKIIVCALSGGLSVVFGLITYVLFLSLCLKIPYWSINSSMVKSVIDQYQFGVGYVLNPIIIENKAIIYYVLSFYLVFIICAFWSIVGLVASTFITDRFFTVFFPYMLFFTESTLFNYPMKTYTIMRGNFNFGMGILGDILFVTAYILLLIYGLSKIFIFKVKRKISNETN